jgi:hypothetical protein
VLFEVLLLKIRIYFINTSRIISNTVTVNRVCVDGFKSAEENVMNEVIFLGIAASAGAFKITAIMIAIVWASRSLFSLKGATLKYRHSNIVLPYR